MTQLQGSTPKELMENKVEQHCSSRRFSKEDVYSMSDSSFSNSCKNLVEEDISMMKIKESYPDIEHLIVTGSQPFPMKLMQILSQIDWKDIISWTPNGKSFMIYDKEKLMQVISPNFFLDETKYDSFRKKLRRWGFEVVRRGANCGAFHHQYFQRDNLLLCSKMTASKKKRNIKRASIQNDNGINLNEADYHMPCTEVTKKDISNPYQVGEQSKNINIHHSKYLNLKFQHNQWLLRESLLQKQMDLLEEKLKMKNILQQQRQHQHTMNRGKVTNAFHDLIGTRSCMNGNKQSYNNFGIGTPYSNSHNLRNQNLEACTTSSPAKFLTMKYIPLLTSNKIDYKSCSMIKINKSMALKKKIKFRKDCEVEENAVNVCKISLEENNEVEFSPEQRLSRIAELTLNSSNSKAA